MPRLIPHRWNPTLGRAAALGLILSLGLATVQAGDPPPKKPPAKAAHKVKGLSDEQVQTALDLIRSRRPALAARLEMLRDDDLRTALGKLMPRLHWLLDMKRTDPAGFELYKQQWELETKAGETARKYRAAKGPAADKLKQELHDLAVQYFELHHKILDHEVDKLEAQVVKIRNEIKNQQDHRDQSVEQHLHRLLTLPSGDALAPGNADTTPPKKPVPSPPPPHDQKKK